MQLHGCSVIRSLSADQSNKGRVSAAGGMEAVVMAMRAHPANSAVQEAACGALKSLAASEEIRSKPFCSRAIEAVVVALKAHQGAKLAEEACGAVCNLAVNNPGNKQSIADAGGIDAVVTAMRAHLQLTGVQEAACAALWSMASDSEENQRLIVDAGGITAVINAMNAHPQVVEVQMVGCAALRNLAELEENEEVVASAGGIEAVLQALRVHGNSSTVQEVGCEALAMVVKSQLEIQRWALQARAERRNPLAPPRHFPPAPAPANPAASQGASSRRPVSPQAGALEVCKAAITTRFPQHEGVRRVRPPIASSPTATHAPFSPPRHWHAPRRADRRPARSARPLLPLPQAAKSAMDKFANARTMRICGLCDPSVTMTADGQVIRTGEPARTTCGGGVQSEFLISLQSSLVKWIGGDGSNSDWLARTRRHPLLPPIPPSSRLPALARPPRSRRSRHLPHAAAALAHASRRTSSSSR